MSDETDPSLPDDSLAALLPQEMWVRLEAYRLEKEKLLAEQRREGVVPLNAKFPLGYKGLLEKHGLLDALGHIDES